ncbi:MAG: GNAT family N-acetyltransferase [Candidatus Gastranaerophilales bacterium]|nr:GNAT family N-acetyltransferase [Candidatus Gastranaerophilales bacterium]
MNITQINNLKYPKYNGSFCENKENQQKKENFHNNYLEISKIPSEALKANFTPLFGKLRKVGDVELIDRKSGNTVKASLKKEQTGDYVLYKIFKGKDEAGYIDINKKSLFPEGDYVLTEPDNVIPEIKHLRSLKGNEYAGIGTALVKAAVDESIKDGKGGCLWARTEKGYAYNLSGYRQNENPIPFYYKMGFKSISPKTDKYIQECIKTSEYDKLPNSSILLLSSQTVKNNKKIYGR